MYANTKILLVVTEGEGDDERAFPRFVTLEGEYSSVADLCAAIESAITHNPSPTTPSCPESGENGRTHAFSSVQ